MPANSLDVFRTKLERKFHETDSVSAREEVAKFMRNLDAHPAMGLD